MVGAHYRKGERAVLSEHVFGDFRFIAAGRRGDEEAEQRRNLTEGKVHQVVARRGVRGARSSGGGADLIYTHLFDKGAERMMADGECSPSAIISYQLSATSYQLSANQ